MKLKVYVLILLLVSLCLTPMARATVEVPKRMQDVPIYENATIVQAMEAEEFAQVVYRVSAELKEVIKWYKDIMLKKGWKVVMEMNMENNSMLNLAKDNSTLVVNARVDQDGQTTVHLVLEEK